MLRRLTVSATRLVQPKQQWVSPWPATTVPSSRPRPFSSSLRRKGVAVGNFQEGYTGGFELTFLGTSSQGGACRYPSSLALRLRGSSSSEVWIFDAGEGCIAQLQRSYMRLGAVQNVFVTHVHGDHIYGLPGLILSVLSHRHSHAGALAAQDPLPPLRVYGPQGVRNFLRMALGVASSTLPLKDALQINEIIFPPEFGRSSQKFRSKRAQPYWKSTVRQLPYELNPRDFHPAEDPLHPGQFTYNLIGAGCPEDGPTRRISKSPYSVDRFEGDGAPATVVAAPVLHTVPCLAYTVKENVISRRFDKQKLAALGIPTSSSLRTRNLFQTWLKGEPALWSGQLLQPDEVMTDGRPARSVCVVGDTHDASGAAHIAKDVDVLVHEATKLAAETHTARKRGHSSTRGATAFAKRVSAKRLLLNHTSVAYSEPKLRVLEAEARALFGVDKVYVARDLSVFNIPTEEEDDDNFVFRRFVGYNNANDCALQRALVANAEDELVSSDNLPSFSTEAFSSNGSTHIPNMSKERQSSVNANVSLNGASSEEEATSREIAVDAIR